MDLFNITPVAKNSFQSECDKAFELASRVCSGLDFLEEFLSLPLVFFREQEEQ